MSVFLLILWSETIMFVLFGICKVDILSPFLPMIGVEKWRMVFSLVLDMKGKCVFTEASESDLRASYHGHRCAKS